jgi:hypothetical protein
MPEIEKRYQVFVSSTFEDLQAERQEVMHALLELDCMPAGMELFPAANDEQWELIKRVIDDCDYYIVIVGGRYGTTGKNGFSYTEMEYRYALDKDMPIIGFLHKEPDSIAAKKTESSTEGKGKLKLFRELVGSKMCKYWKTPEDLGSVVSRSLIKLIKTNPAIGWIKANNAYSDEASSEILRLKNQIENLQAEIARINSGPPAGSETLSQGDDEASFRLIVKIPKKDNQYSSESYIEYINLSWNGLFSAASPLMIDEADSKSIENVIDNYVYRECYSEIKKREPYKNTQIKDIGIHSDDFKTIIIQFRALGLIIQSNKKRSLKDNRTYWSLTPYGDKLMTSLRAIKKECLVSSPS